jgi:hypothetical protein
MKTVTALLLAGILTASAGVAGINHQMAEERYRAKYGRYSPAEERRQHASEGARRNTAIGCATEGCCRVASQDTAAGQNHTDTRTLSDAAERFIAKWGRKPFESKTSRVMDASSVTAATAPSYSANDRSVHGGDAAARLQAKTGRTAQLPPDTTQARVRDSELLAQASVTYEHECCAGHQ